jgi:hypothetical protein
VLGGSAARDEDDWGHDDVRDRRREVGARKAIRRDAAHFDPLAAPGLHRVFTTPAIADAVTGCHNACHRAQDRLHRPRGSVKKQRR